MRLERLKIGGNDASTLHRKLSSLGEIGPLLKKISCLVFANDSDLKSTSSACFFSK